ncbi:TIGR03668 family PPOX class F420-dependent oxidoreductase [Oscillochloris sp. ZM17-4]|uniref:TIGR03668 family PPOX class F420-dependent oxidoreductase n=1 Tax=Oscillochloris sp. ZM17-4 TaxID=2866714 RepID=UPI001C737BA7|nr:TIGR03668 family PPOX class F420-dependent oxidoreductase [Oscillochloris sp. ZM17-4]MBX0329703.1 TIGR03668 family PPOX class F420-dependent oxidoreductase [Oscillochloris sp. ZM17-4]
MTDWQQEVLQTARVARLATVDDQGQPHVLPIVFAYDGRRLYTPLDGKPKQVALDRLQRVKNIAANDQVAVVVDHYDEDWQQLAWVQLRGRAAVIMAGEDYDAGIALLQRKYPQYTAMPLDGHPLIVVQVARLRSWRAADATA